MKNMKKLFSLALALVMMMALVVTAGATSTDPAPTGTPSTPTGSITVDNPQSNQTYTAYKIFDMTWNGANPDNYSYVYTKTGTTEAASELDNLVTTYFNTQEIAGNNNKVTVLGFKGGDYDAPAFAAALHTATTRTEPAPLTLQGGVALTVAEGKDPTASLPLGYYFVTSTTGTLCNLDSNAPDVVIYDKNEKPVIDKEVDDEDKSVYVGQVLNYTITGKIPDTTGYDSYTYKISDTMGKGLTYKKGDATKPGVEVSIDRVTYNQSDVVITETDNGFEITIDVMKMQQSVGAEIRVNYSATVNKDAVDADEADTTNNATLTYSNDPNSVDVGKHESKVTVYTADIEIVKYDGSTASVDASNKLVATDTDKGITYLQGAKFILARVNPDTYAAFAGDYQYYVVNNDTKVVSWTSEIDEATPMTTDANGHVTIKGLENGDYALIETEAPKGFNLLTEPVPVTVAVEEPHVTIMQNVANLNGTELPATGGIGTTIFTVTGAILMIGAAVLFLTKKRSEA